MTVADIEHERWLRANERLVRGEPGAMEDLCKLAYELLCRHVAVRFKKLDDQLRQEAVAKALLEHGKHPSRYDPDGTVSLERYLQIIAWRRADNLWRGEQRRKRAERRAAQERPKLSVVADPLAGNMLQEEVERYLSLLSDEADRRFARLLADGVTDPRQLAGALGLSQGLPAATLKAAIKRARDRIRQTFRRKGPNHE